MKLMFACIPSQTSNPSPTYPVSQTQVKDSAPCTHSAWGTHKTDETE